MSVLGAFALRLASAFRNWSSSTGEPALTYFAGSRTRHGGDELRLRSALIKDYILQDGFGYAPDQIEIEAADRADVVLFAGKSRRAVALVETKRSGFGDLLNTVQPSGETPPQQLERYVRLRGLYLGLLTDGDVWHILDFGVGLEPRASFSLVELATLVTGVADARSAAAALDTAPILRDALRITQRMFDATAWDAVDAALTALNDPNQFHSIALDTNEKRSGLIRQITQELHLLHNTIAAQFALLQRNLTQYYERRLLVSAADDRTFTAVVEAEKEAILSAIPEELREQFGTMLARLIEGFIETGDMDGTYAAYTIEGATIARQHQTQLTLLLNVASEQSTTAPALSLLPLIDSLMAVLDAHRRYEEQLATAYAASLRLDRAYGEWKQRVRGVFAKPDQEFCLQTSYIHFVRLFFVRVCEDYGLIGRRISNGPFTQFDSYRRSLLAGVSDVYQRLLDETFERAASIYHNFFSRHVLYDWYKLDEQTILAILAVVNRYDFSLLDFDLLGKIYNEGYIEEKSRSERGQFYTPPEVVAYILDSLQMPTLAKAVSGAVLTPVHRQFVRGTAIDLACGSGSFLVEIAARKAAILEHMVDAAEISPMDAIEHLVGTLVGFDLNPFACYLAEINLLIRCMPFLRHPTSTGIAPSVSSITRMHIYCTDSLEPTRRELIQSKQIFGTRQPPMTRQHHVSDEERAVQQIKDDKTVPGRFAVPGRGFDYVVGNPPYVRADESVEMTSYRDQIRSWGFYKLRVKWDLFVPFIYRKLQFVANSGWLGFITSNAIETEGYATQLRADLCAFHLEQQTSFRNSTSSPALVFTTQSLFSGG